ncbi:MAG: phenylalanine--tRNA ligase beta subunit-related protein [Acidobacteriota bacterium]
MQLIIADSIFEAHPELVLGIVTAHGIDNSQDRPEISDLLRAAQASLPARIGDGVLSQHPHIAPWREAYRRFGAKPKKYPSSIENMVKRVLKGASIGHINNLVALYNVVSLTHVVPVGGEDLDAIEGDVWLTVAGDEEAPVRLLGEREARPPYPREIIYKDDVGTICRRWNWKEADRTKLTHETRHAVLVIESIPPIPRTTLTRAVSELAELVRNYCGGEVSSKVLDAEQRQCSLEREPGVA